MTALPCSLRLFLVLAVGLRSVATQQFPEDAFARRRTQLEHDADGCVPLVSSVRTDEATLMNGSQVALGAWVDSNKCVGGSHWRLVALAPGASHETTDITPDAVIWEQHATQDVWGISFVPSQPAPGQRRPSLVFPKPVTMPSAVTYPPDLPPWFVGTYWRQTVLPSAEDLLADRMLTGDVSYDQIAQVLPRLTGQMGEKLESVRHRGGPSFVSDPSSNKWWQVRQNGEIVVGDTTSREGTTALPVLHPAFRPRPNGFEHPDQACEWPNHDGPAPAHTTACMHVQGLVGGWLPIINQGLRDTNGGSALEQLVLASGDSLFLGNRSGSVDGGWDQWNFYWTTPDNQARLQRATPNQFVGALLKVALDAKDFIDGTALSESRLVLPADPILGDAARASLLLARATYTDLHPHYGVGTSYWAQANDGFPPTTLAMTHTLCAVGAPSAAADRLGYFLRNMVNNVTGSVIYYGTCYPDCIVWDTPWL